MYKEAFYKIAYGVTSQQQQQLGPETQRLMDIRMRGRYGRPESYGVFKDRASAEAWAKEHGTEPQGTIDEKEYDRLQRRHEKAYNEELAAVQQHQQQQYGLGMQLAGRTNKQGQQAVKQRWGNQENASRYMAQQKHQRDTQAWRNESVNNFMTAGNNNGITQGLEEVGVSPSSPQQFEQRQKAIDNKYAAARNFYKDLDNRYGSLYTTQPQQQGILRPGIDVDVFEDPSKISPKRYTGEAMAANINGNKYTRLSYNPRTDLLSGYNTTAGTYGVIPEGQNYIIGDTRSYLTNKYAPTPATNNRWATFKPTTPTYQTNTVTGNYGNVGTAYNSYGSVAQRNPVKNNWFGK